MVLERRVRSGLIKWIESYDWDMYVTFNFNCSASPISARTNVKGFLARLDSHFLGRNWSKVGEEDRTFLIGFMENIESNLHVHALLRLPPPMRERPFYRNDKRIELIWKKLMPSGTIDAQLPLNIPQIAKYISKQLDEDRPELILISNDFHHSKGSGRVPRRPPK